MGLMENKFATTERLRSTSNQVYISTFQHPVVSLTSAKSLLIVSDHQQILEYFMI